MAALPIKKLNAFRKQDDEPLFGITASEFHSKDNQNISHLTRTVKARAQYTLRKRIRDFKRHSISGSIDILDKRFKPFHLKVNENQ